MMEKTPWMQRANKEVVATLSTEAGTHGKGSIPSAQADLLDLSSTSIKPAVFFSSLSLIPYIFLIKNKPCSRILKKEKKIQIF